MSCVEMTKDEEIAYTELKEMLVEEARLRRQLPWEIEMLVMEYARPRYRKPKHAAHIKAFFKCKEVKEECEFSLTSAMLCFALPPLILTGLRLWGGVNSP